jgi:hypothetical protein
MKQYPNTISKTVLTLAVMCVAELLLILPILYFILTLLGAV